MKHMARNAADSPGYREALTETSSAIRCRLDGVVIADSVSTRSADQVERFWDLDLDTHRVDVPGVGRMIDHQSTPRSTGRCRWIRALGLEVLCRPGRSQIDRGVRPFLTQPLSSWLAEDFSSPFRKVLLGRTAAADAETLRMTQAENHTEMFRSLSMTEGNSRTGRCFVPQHDTWLHYANILSPLHHDPLSFLAPKVSFHCQGEIIQALLWQEVLRSLGVTAGTVRQQCLLFSSACAGRHF